MLLSFDSSICHLTDSDAWEHLLAIRPLFITTIIMSSRIEWIEQLALEEVGLAAVEGAVSGSGFMLASE